MLAKRFARDRRGSAAVEFALVIPIGLLLYYSMCEATEALIVDRRVGYIATAVSDLTTQYGQLKKDDVDDIFAISAKVMGQYPTAPLTIRVTSIENDANGNPVKKWSRPYPSTLTGEPDLSDIEKTANLAIVRTETTYTFDSPIKKIFPNAVVFKHRMDMRPRGGAYVKLAD